MKKMEMCEPPKEGYRKHGITDKVTYSKDGINMVGNSNHTSPKDTTYRHNGKK